MALGTPAFVVGIDAETSAVQLGGEDDLLHVGATLTGASFFDDVAWPIRAAVRVRYRHQGVAATLTRDKAAIRVVFEEPVRAVSKGQVAVAYSGDRVLGGGTIERAHGEGCA